jgi:dihydrofolate reductase
MSEIIVTEYVSIDGVVQAPGHAQEDIDGGFSAGGWTGPFMADHRRLNQELLPGAGGFLLGRRTYDIFASYWPTVTDPADTIATVLNARPKVVVSATLRDPGWGPASVVAPADIGEAVGGLRSQAGRPYYVIGSSQLAHRLFDLGLVDEYQLCVHPVVVGQGKRLFGAAAAPAPMRLVESRTTATGLVLLTYRPGLA